VSGQRGRSAVAADHRSALPRVPGIPWWGAIVLGATCTAIGFAYDAGSGAQDLSAVFAVFYVAGCLLAVLAVRQSGVFTAVIQPPLLLFASVPTAYYLFHSSEVGGIKDLLINCGYPLIERFPLMFFTSAVVLIIGLARWYMSLSARRGVATTDDDAEEPEKPKRARARARATVDETTVLEAVEETPKRRKRERERPAERPSRVAAAEPEEIAEPPRRPRKSARPAPAAGTSRSRHARPPETEFGEPAPRPRRRPASPAGPPVDPEPRRRPRTPSSREPRRNLPPIDSPSARAPHERPERRERPRRAEYERPERGERQEPRRRRASDYEFDGFEGRPTNGTHHPVSRVRYRGDDAGEPESRPAPRRPYSSDADSWEYDV
jgi:hypothetical protein